MKKFSLLLNAILLMNLISLQSEAEEIVFRSHEGELLVVQVEPNDSFMDVLHLMQNQSIQEEVDLSDDMLNQDYLVDFMAALDKSHFNSSKSKSVAKSVTRDYYAGLTAADQKELNYIITTLGNSSLVNIAKQRSSLKKAGDRIDHIHPFWFVLGIMLNEKNKAALYNIIERSWVYSGFFKGLSTSLTEEAEKGNLKPEYIQDFATKLNIDPAAITPALNEKRWQDFFDIVIKLVPRTGNPGRYDM